MDERGRLLGRLCLGLFPGSKGPGSHLRCEIRNPCGFVQSVVGGLACMLLADLLRGGGGGGVGVGCGGGDGGGVGGGRGWGGGGGGMSLELCVTE